MKHGMIMSGIFSLLLVLSTAAFAEQGNQDATTKPDARKSDAVKVERAAPSDEKSEFSAMESENQSTTRLKKKLSSDDLSNEPPDVPRDWYDANY